MNLSVLKSFTKNTSGFTLIELLVVIGILGILAAALVATIDPFEQLNKASDANAKNTAVEFNNAVIRYYSTHNAMPWASAGATCLANGASPTGQTFGTASLDACLSALINDGELKSGFTTATGVLTSIRYTEASNNLTVCYKPLSKSQKRDANAAFDSTGAPTTGCASQTASSNVACYWCTH